MHLLLAAIESCVKFISRNTYILIAMRNLGFLRASAHAVGLLTTNVFYLVPLKVSNVCALCASTTIPLQLYSCTFHSNPSHY